MNPQFNEQFVAATRQFADTAAQVNRIALENAQAVFGLQLATLEDRANAAFAFWGEAAEVRDADGLKNLLPKGAQVARETVERSVATGQEVLGRTVKANEQIGEIAKSQFEAAAKTTQANVEQATKAATEKAESFARGATKASKAK
ncbi:MAG: phasin family protein [Lysobacter sp.]